MDLNKLWGPSFNARYYHGTAERIGATDIVEKDWGKEKILNLDAIMDTAIRRATDNLGGTSCTRNSSTTNHGATIANADTTAPHV